MTPTTGISSICYLNLRNLVCVMFSVLSFPELVTRIKEKGCALGCRRQHVIDSYDESRQRVKDSYDESLLPQDTHKDLTATMQAKVVLYKVFCY